MLFLIICLSLSLLYFHFIYTTCAHIWAIDVILEGLGKTSATNLLCLGGYNLA